MAKKKKDVLGMATDIANPAEGLDPTTENEKELTAADESEDSKEWEPSDFSELLRQVDSEFEVSRRFMKPKWNKHVTRLKLYNNQKRDDAAVGDPLLFTTFQTVFASLYDDKMQQTFEPKEEGDAEVAECLDDLSNHDYDVMELDYPVFHDWQWDACFFGRAVIDMSEFDREGDKTTVPYVVDPLTMFRDPKAVSVRGYKGRGSLRWFGYEIAMTKAKIDELPDLINRDLLSKCETKTEVQINHELRNAAQGYDQDEKSVQIVGENAEYIFYVWYTHYKGNKVRLLVSHDRKVVHRVLNFGKRKYFPLEDMAIYPMPGSWDGVNIPDLVEDKQRHRAAVINASVKSVKFSQNPAYLFDVNKVDKNNIARTEFGNLIPTNGAPAGSVELLPRDFVKSDVQWILDVLDGAAQRATATPEIQQGVNARTERTLGELSLVASKVDTRYSLTAKIFSTAYKRFWQSWYLNYKEYFADVIDEKVIRISGVNGARFRKLTRDNIIARVDPDVKIESKVVVESRKFNDLNTFNSFHSQAMKDPGYNVRGGLKRMAELSNLKRDEINILFRKTADEIEAERENEYLAADKLIDKDGNPLLKITQDHDAHIEMHAKAADTKAKQAHILAHEKAKLLIRDNPNVAGIVQQSMMQNAPQENPNDAAYAATSGMSSSDMNTQVNPIKRA